MIKRLMVRLSVAAVILGSSLNMVGTTSYYRIRSQSTDSARELVGWAHLINQYNPEACDNEHVFAITPEYTRSYDSDDIAFCLFGKDCLKSYACPTLKISGSRVEGRGQKDWLADYFGLSTDFESSITFNPRIENYLVDFNYYVSFDSWCTKGVYFRVHAPVVYSKWNLNYCETVAVRGEASYDEGYFATVEIKRDRLLDSFSDYVTECKVPDLGRIGDSDSTAGANGELIIFEPLGCSKWASRCDTIKETKLSDIQLALGWNFWLCDDYHAGLNVRASIPTGNRPDCNLFFEPIVGNGHHWEVGVGFTAHHTFWRDCDDSQSVGWYVDMNITHLFKDRQCRVFDLKNKCNSRYMLAAALGTPVNELQQSDTNPSIVPSAQFKHKYTPVANLTKTLVDVTVPVQVDLAVMFSYTRCNWSIDFGYNFWYRSCEKLRFDVCDNCQSPLVNNRKWALKGDAHMYGFVNIGESTLAIPLSATESQATVHKGTNNFAGPDTTFNNPAAGINSVGPTRNPGVDNAQLADVTNGDNINDTRTGGQQTNTSIDPIFLSHNDIDICGARTQGLSHRFFSYYGYTWCEDECGRIPYLGFGYSVEFGQDRASTNKSTDTTCGDFSCLPCEKRGAECNRCSLSQWAIWLKGGWAFN